MTYQRISLATGNPVGDPGPLPFEVANWSADKVADLSGLDPAYGFTDTGFWPVVDDVPAYDPETHRVVHESTAVDTTRRIVSRRFVAVADTERLKASILASTQAALDAFAETRNYSGIMSACTYVSSTNPKFAAEGAYCVQLRDDTWAKLYTMLAEVQAGTRAIPSSFTDIAPELPVSSAAWPA